MAMMILQDSTSQIRIVMGGLRESPAPWSWKFDEDGPGNHRVYCGSDDEAP